MVVGLNPMIIVDYLMSWFYWVMVAHSIIIVVVRMMIKAIAELKKYNARLTTVLNELETLEDGVDADYTDVITDIRWNVLMLENRRESLQRRGRTQ